MKNTSLYNIIKPHFNILICMKHFVVGDERGAVSGNKRMAGPGREGKGRDMVKFS